MTAAAAMPQRHDVVNVSGLPDPYTVVHVIERGDWVVIFHSGTRTARVIHASQCTPIPKAEDRCECGCSLAHVVGPGAHWATWCPECDADNLAAEFDDISPTTTH